MVRLLRKQVSGRQRLERLPRWDTALFLSPHRLEMDRRNLVLFSLVAACACGDSSHRSAAKDTSIGPSIDGKSSGEVAPAVGTAAPNLQGRIPVLEYHVIGGDKNAAYTRTAASYRADLEEAYKQGYRPITISQMLDKNFSDVPAGMSPVVVVFDDASDSQFRYLEQGGKLVIDPTSAVGIWLDFAKTHPGWKNRAVFCMLNGGAAGHNFFGDNPKWNGQKKEWRLQKVKWLADNGFELCDHTLWHAMLNKYPDAVVQEQIARNAMGIDSAVPGYKIRTMALPYGLWPKNKQLAWQGSWTDPKTKQTHTYKFEAVLEVAGGPARSPYDPQFNPKSINRIQAVGDDIRRQLDKLAKDNTRFVAK
jgi:hypothetical protein